MGLQPGYQPRLQSFQDMTRTERSSSKISWVSLAVVIQVSKAVRLRNLVLHHPGLSIGLLLLFSCSFWLFATPWTAAYQASLSFTISWILLKLMSIVLVMPSNCLIFCHPLLLLSSVFLNIRVFSSYSTLHIRWPKYWSFSISPSNEYSGLISFRID